MAFSNPDDNTAGISGSGPGIVAGASAVACAIGDLIVIAWQLNNVASGDAGMQAQITDNVNAGGYAFRYATYDATNVRLHGVSSMVANAAGVPTVTLANDARYSGGQLSYALFKGFTGSPAFDSASNGSSGSGSPVTASISPNQSGSGTGELLLVLPFGGNLPGANPGSWFDLFSFSGADISEPGWQGVSSPGSQSFSKAQNVSAPWWCFIVGFSDGVVIIPPAGKLVLTTAGKIVPAAGTLLLVGRAPLAITPGTSVLTLTGTVPSLNVFQKIQPAAAALGISADLRNYAPLQLLTLPSSNAAVLALAGITPVVIVNVGHAIPPTAALSLAGVAPVARRGLVLTPSNGALALIGQVPTAASHSIFPGVATLNLGAAPPALAWRTVPLSGALALGPTTATITVGMSVYPSVGALTLVGASGVIDTRIVPTGGTAVLVGSPSQVAGAAASLSPAAVALALTGSAPLAVVSRALLPSTATLALTGQLAQIPTGATQVATPPTAALALTGVAGVASTSYRLSPNIGALILTGTVQVNPQGVGVQPGAGALTVAGVVPVASASASIRVPPANLGVFGNPPEFTALMQVTPYPGGLSLVGTQPVFGAVGVYEFDPYFYVPGRNTTGKTFQLPAIGAGEDVIATFNFADELLPGETLQGAPTVTVKTAVGTDAYPADVLAGPPAYDPTIKQIMVPITNGVVGCYYLLTAQAQTSNPRKKLARYALLPVLYPAGQTIGSVSILIVPATGAVASDADSASYVPRIS